MNNLFFLMSTLPIGIPTSLLRRDKISEE